MLAVEYENNAMIVKVDTDDEYEFARDMQMRLFVIQSKYVDRLTTADDDGDNELD